MAKTKTFNLAYLLSIAVETVPADREALVCGSRRATFRPFHERTQQLALWLRGQGIETRDTIGINSYNCIEFVEATFAAYMLKGLVYGAPVAECVADALDVVPELKAGRNGRQASCAIPRRGLNQRYCRRGLT